MSELWDYDSFVAKAKLYFGRFEADARSPEEFSSEATLWLLLGLEFLVRAPLARVHPTLLANPEGKSILHAAGFQRQGENPRSIATKTVVDRVLHIDPSFGEDRGKDILFLADLRNAELHTSDAALQSLPIKAWLPKFIDVVEALCEHLSLKVCDFLAEELVDHARSVRDRTDRALVAAAKRKLAVAKALYGGLRVGEVDSRRSFQPVDPAGQSRQHRSRQCPACEQDACDLWLSGPRFSPSIFDEEDGTISYTSTYVVEEVRCRVCDLYLDSTALVVAAHLPRLVIEEHEEDRYEGWESAVTYSEALERLGIDGPDFDYGND